MTATAEQGQPASAPMPTPNFPVAWQQPEEAGFLWMHDRMHAPDPIMPADGAFFQYAYEHGITMAARAYDLPLHCVARRINTYVYLALVPIPAPGGEQEAQGRRAQEKRGMAMARLGESWHGEYLPEIERYLAEWDAVDLRGAALPDLLAQLDASIDRTKRLYEIHMLLWFPFMMAISAFEDLYRELFAEEGAFGAHRLLQGFDNQTVASGRALWRLSRQALASPVVRTVLEERAAGDVLAELDRTPEGRAFLAKLRGYLEEYGQRGEGWGWSHPSWLEEPTPVIKNLKDYVAQPDRDLEAEAAALVAERERLVAATRERLRGYPQAVRDQFEFLLQAAQEAIVLTEDHGFWIDFRCMHRVRRVLLEFGRRFAEAGSLDRPADVFYLTPEEVRDTARAQGRVDRRALVGARRAEIEYYRTIAPPAALGTPPPGPPATDPLSVVLGKFFGAPPESPAEPNVVRGNAGSPGTARGPARVVRALAEAGKLRPGDVLVVETTAPPWTPLFATAAAIVTDTGGILSHCAVVAREYGIPAVVGTGVATAVIRDGQLLEVDGDAGIVRLAPGV